ncbi:MAG: amidohydrolase family protein [Acidobacteria bacterium]|nr:amidohydrolase family protein [Acidobacteriota bacterium]MCH8990403.1 amidohydrolase family protein [Acidobacteriota bacterium]
MVDLAIVNGTVVVPGEEPRLAELAIDDEKVTAIYPAGTAVPADERIDASGLHVFPGAIDPHIHLGGYQDLAIDTEPGTGLAALGGVTTLVNYFKDTGSYLDLVPTYIETYEGGAYIDSAFHLQLLTEPHLGELAETTHRFGITSYKINLAWKGREKAVFDSDRSIDNGWVWSVMLAMRDIDPEHMVLNVHCENQELKNEARLRIEDEMDPSLRFYEQLAPDFTETDSVLSMMLLARMTGVTTYLVHLSAALTMEALALDWADNPKLIGETCPHYLMHTVDSDAGLKATVSPPVRTQRDQDALWEALGDGRLDTVGSDSNPILRKTKMGDGEFWSIKPGFDGVGFIVPTLLDGGYHRRRLPLGRIAQIMAENPARIFGLYPAKGTIAEGSDADLVIVDLEAEHTVTDDATAAHSDFSIFEGMTFRGWPVMTISRGEIIAQDGKLVGKPGRGRYLRRQVAASSGG